LIVHVTGWFLKVQMLDQEHWLFFRKTKMGTAMYVQAAGSFPLRKRPSFEVGVWELTVHWEIPATQLPAKISSFLTG
jgi:hypothetical protein